MERKRYGDVRRLDESALCNPKAKGAKPEDFVDSIFVKKVDDEGLFDRLYKR